MSTAIKDTPEALVANVSQLTSLPSVYTRLEDILKRPNHTRDDIAAVISIDPALCARTLRIINSSYYALPKIVDNIPTAINLIGEYDLRNIVLVTSTTNAVAALVDNGIDIVTFWHHSIRCGIIAKLLAKSIAIPNADLFFLTGLLHDIGQLVIYKNEPKLSAIILWNINNKDKSRDQIEHTLLGFSHATVGALLLEGWGVPEQVCEAIKFHHQPEHSIHYQQETLLISLTDQLVHFIESKNNLAQIEFEKLPELINHSLNSLNISRLILIDLLSDAVEQSQAIEKIICNN